MSPKTFRYLLAATFFAQVAAIALPIEECIYEDQDDPLTIKDVGHQVCVMKYDFDQGDMFLDEYSKKRLNVVVFPHLSHEIILAPKPAFFDCGTCDGCEQYLTECPEQPDFVDVQLCSSLVLEPSSELCVVNTDYSRQYIFSPSNSTAITFIDPHQKEGIGEDEMIREKRYAQACSYPNALETAQINCRLYPKKVKCIQRCAFGYTLDKGIEQKMECNLTENVWKPTGFRECRPFVDCTLTLVSPGDANCTSMSLRDQPSCRVLCLVYEDKEAVPEDVYTCDINGKWDPPLPFCAKPGTGLLLTKEPKKKLHDDDDDDERESQN